MKKIYWILSILSLTVGAVYAHVDHAMINDDQSEAHKSMILENFSLDNTVEHR